jgi:nicotinamidase-related amidase
MKMTIDRFKQPALVVVDMQNDFVRVGAPLEVPTARDTIPAHRALIAECRRLGIPVIYTKFLAGPERTLIWQWSPALAPPVRCCWKGVKRAYGDTAELLECTEIIAELAPEPGDPIVEKFGYGSFHNTHLDDLLRARRVESVLITGTVTQICVDETARESFQRGYPTTIVADAVSSYLPDLHDATLKNFALKFGWVSTSDEVIAELRRHQQGGSQEHEAVPPRTNGDS